MTQTLSRTPATAPLPCAVIAAPCNQCHPMTAASARAVRPSAFRQQLCSNRAVIGGTHATPQEYTSVARYTRQMGTMCMVNLICWQGGNLGRSAACSSVDRSLHQECRVRTFLCYTLATISSRGNAWATRALEGNQRCSFCRSCQAQPDHGSNCEAVALRMLSMLGPRGLVS